MQAAVTLLVSLSLAACLPTSLQMDREQLVTAEDFEGFVVGSVEIRIVPEVDPSFLAKLSPKAEGADFELELDEYRDTRMLFDDPFHSARKYTLALEAGPEQLFVSKLSAGRYSFGSFYPRGYERNSVHLGPSFTVTNRQLTYVGRLVISVPARLPNPSDPRVLTITHTVESDPDAALAAARAKYPGLLPDLEVRDPMH